MTRTQDKLAVDAAKAAALIKSTAESTATALNIQYMQKDISEIKESIKSLVATNDGRMEELQQQIAELHKQQWMIGGAVTTLAFAIPLFLKFIVQ